MSIYTLFNHETPAIRPPAGGGQPASAPVERQGTFVTPQSLTSFAGASLVITVIWKILLGSIDPAWRESRVAALICAIVVGAVIFVINETDPDAGERNARTVAIDGFVAFVNALILFSTAVGATTAAGVNSEWRGTAAQPSVTAPTGYR